ncbi:MAG: hypothetical protein JSS04_07130 [Proteobacteria bacterium]|nr:hypothetical protein [Pseudomonadota bacterium]
MRKSLVAVLAVVVVAGAAVAAVPTIERYAARQIKADMERDGQATVGAVEVGLFDRRISIKDMHFKGAGDVRIGRWQASGLAWPLSELIEGRTPFSGLELGDPFQARHLELHDLEIVDRNVRWTIASAVADDLRLDRYQPVQGEGQFTALSMRIMKAVSLGRLEQTQSVFTDPATGNKVAIGKVTIANYDKSKAGSFEVKDLDVTPKGASAPAFRMADMKLAGLDLHRPINAMSVAGWRPGMPIGRIELESASLTGFGGEGLTRNGISLGSITQQTTHEAGDVKRTRLRVEGFVIAPPSGAAQALQLRTALQSMGLDELRLESDCSGTEDRAKGEVSIDRCVLSGPDLGELTLAFKLVNADKPFWTAIDDGNTFAILASKVGLASARVSLADHGLLDRTLKAVATNSGQLVVSVRNGFAQEVRRYQPPGILITDDLTRILDTVARFIETGGTLTLDARPETPIGIDKLPYFRQPGPDLVNMLGLSATLSK